MEVGLQVCLKYPPIRIAYSFQQRKRKKSEELQNLRQTTKNEPSLPVLVGLKVHTKTGKCSLVDTLADEGIA